MTLRQITPPDDDVEIVSLDTVKLHCRVDHDVDDDILQLYIAAVISHLDGKDGYLQRALRPQVWEVAYDSFPCYGPLFIPLPPTISIDSLKYDDAEGTEQTIDPDSYYTDLTSLPGRVEAAYAYTWPTTLQGPSRVRVRFTAGYADLDSPSGSSAGLITGVPTAIKAAILLMVGDLFMNRETVSPNSISEIPMAPSVKALLAPYRIPALA